jgi:hypothetical protein
MAAQVTEKSFSVTAIKAMNKTILHLKATPKKGITYPRLDRTSLRLKVYADSSFANNEDLTSQLGYLVLLTDKNDRCNIIHYSSHKSRRVTRSVLGGEVHAFADAFDYAIVLKRDLEAMLSQEIPLTMLTDSKSLFDVITKSSTTTERRLMIDISAVRNAYDVGEIQDVGWVRTNFNPADAFTKIGSCEALESIVASNSSKLPIEQWVIRKGSNASASKSDESGGV